MLEMLEMSSCLAFGTMISNHIIKFVGYPSVSLGIGIRRLPLFSSMFGLDHAILRFELGPYSSIWGFSDNHCLETQTMKLDRTLNHQIPKKTFSGIITVFSMLSIMKI